MPRTLTIPFGKSILRRRARDGEEIVNIVLVFLNACENQDRTDCRLPILLELPTRHRDFIAEPMLEGINMERYLATGLIEHVTCGGESGPPAKPCDFRRILEVRRQCVRYGVPFTFKQTGAVFIKDGRTYHIARKYQMSQARKSGCSYTLGAGNGSEP